MKKIYSVLFFAMLSLIGCSDNDDNGTTPLQLVKTTETFYEHTQEGIVSGQKMITEYENGRPVMMSVYLYNGFFNCYYKYSYDTTGRLSELLFHYNGNNEETVTTFNYDSQGRLTQAIAEHSDGTTGYYTYIYDGNTVTYTYSFPPTNYADTITYYLNSNNTVQKQVWESAGTVTEYLYNNLTVTAANTTLTNGSTNNYSFIYDENHDLSLLGLEDFTGGIPFNRYFILKHLYYFDDTVVPYIEKYLIQIQQENVGETNIQYEFNDAGLPLTRSTDYGNDNSLKLEFTYE